MGVINMGMFIIIFLGSAVSLFGTMLGASLGVLIQKPSNKLLGAIIGFAGGVMMAVVVFDLIPEALEGWSFWGTIVFCIIGILTVMLMDNVFDLDKYFGNRHLKAAAITALGLMMHNFPEGLIMGCGFMSGTGLGIKMSLVIAIHDVPEGIAVSAPLMVSKVKVSKILLYSAFTALPTALGVGIGAYIGGISKNVLGGCLAFTSGVMLYVVCREMLPESSKLWDGVTSTIGILAGILGGLIITTVL